MSLTSVKDYFRSRCNALGLKEHKDAFNVENVAATRLSKGYHVELGRTAGSKMYAPGALETTTEVTVRLFFKGTRATSEAADLAFEESERLMKAALKASNKFSGSLLDVQFEGMEIGPLDETNDNAIVSTLIFSASVVTDVEGA